MKQFTIHGTESTLNKLTVAAKATTYEKWEKLQEDLTSGMSLRQEDRIMNLVAKRFGMNPIEYDNKKYGVFIDNIWREAKGYNITVKTD